MAAVPSIGRATRVERPAAPGADAAGLLYERYAGQIHSYCLHQLGSREEAEDAVQTTFMNAFRGLSRGIVPELESAWLFKIAHNVCLSRRRSSWRRGKVESPNNFEVLQEIVPGREHVADELIRLQDVLEEMPENQRRAILLREWQGLTYREIATELGLSQAAVETLIFRARRALAQGLEQDARTWRNRVRRGANLGGVVATIKAMLGGGGAAAVKLAATALAVATATVAGASESGSRHAHRAPAPKRIAHAHVVTTKTARTRAFTVVAPKAVKSPARARWARTAERSLPQPAAVPTAHASDPADEPAPTQLPAPESAPTAPTEQPTPPASQPEPPPPPPASADPTRTPGAEPGHGHPGQDTDRRPQSTIQPVEPIEPPSPPAAVTPLVATEPIAAGPDITPDADRSEKPAKADRPDKSDRPNRGDRAGKDEK